MGGKLGVRPSEPQASSVSSVAWAFSPFLLGALTFYLKNKSPRIEIVSFPHFKVLKIDGSVTIYLEGNLVKGREQYVIIMTALIPTKCAQKLAYT